jgi:hypothetical protein
MNDVAKLMSEPALEALGNEMLRLPQAKCDVRHLFAPGLYIRELTMGTGTLALGHAHKTTHLCIVLKGALNVLAPDGRVITLRAPLEFIAQPGRKLAYVVEDCVFINVFPNPDDERDIGKLEERLLIKSEAFQEAHGLKGPNPDWQALLDELGMTAEQVQATSERTEDLIDFPDGEYQVRVDVSPINGKGLFATADFKAGDVICPARIDGRRTPAGRYTNHSNTPNAEPAGVDQSAIYWVATRDIAGCRGGQNGDEITVDYRSTVAWRLAGALS